MFEWDEEKRASNLAKHGVDFELVDLFEWETADVRLDTRQSYGEDRFIAEGMIQGRLFVAVITRRGPTTRLISLRKANVRERRRYEKAKKLYH